MARLRCGGEAWATFQETPLPDRKQEEWMRTDIRGFRFEQFSLPSPESGEGPGVRAEGWALQCPVEAEQIVRPIPSGLLSAGVELSGHAVASDSQPGPEHLDPALARQGVLFGSLDRLVAEHGDLLRPYLVRGGRLSRRQVRRAARRLLVGRNRCSTCPRA